MTTLERKTINITISGDLYDRLYKRVPWGVRNQVMRNLITSMMDSVDATDGRSLAGFLNNQLEIREKQTEST